MKPIVSELNLILLGPPGAGKGTQAARLRDEFGLTHVSTGDLLRRHRAERTDLGLEAAEFMTSGRLVPDSLVIAMLVRELQDADGVLLDGFPRTIAQAEALEEVLERAGRTLTATVLIDVPDHVVVERITGRATCADGPPRDDDRPATVRRRLAVYHKQTVPLVAYYAERGLLVTVDGARTPADVAEEIATALVGATR
jgi:adenylate kinase